MRLKTYLKKLYEIASVENADLKGLEELTEDEQSQLGAIKANIFNGLGELAENPKLQGRWNQ